MIFASFIFFTALVAIITYLKTRKDRLETNDDYFLGGRSLTCGIIAGSLMLTNLSPVSFTGMSAQSYSNNMSVMGWEVGTGIAMIVVALFLVPRYLKAGLTTIPEFIEDRFGSGVKTFITLLFLLNYALGILPVTLYAGAVVLNQLFDLPVVLNLTSMQCIWISAVLIGIIGSIYAVFGGLKAVAISDSLNGVGLIIGGLLVPILGFKLAGGGEIFKGIAEVIKTNPEKFNAVGSVTDPVPFGTLFTGMILVNLYYWGTDQGIIQRVLAAKNLKEGQKGVLFTGLMKIFTPLMVIIPGIIAFHIYGDKITQADQAYGVLARDVLPTYLVGFFAAVMFGALLSTFNSVLNSAMTLFATNVWKSFSKTHKSDHDVIKAGKYFGIILAILSIIVAPQIINAPAGLFDYIQRVSGLFSVPIFTIILIGYTTKRVPSIAAIIALVLFVGTYGTFQFIYPIELHFLHQLAILFVISSALMLIIGKIAPRKTPYEIKARHVVNMKPWKYRYETALIIFSVMVSFYFTFSKLGIASNDMSSYYTAMILLWAATLAGVIAISKFKKPDVDEDFEEENSEYLETDQESETTTENLVNAKVSK